MKGTTIKIERSMMISKEGGYEKKTITVAVKDKIISEGETYYLCDYWDEIEERTAFFKVSLDEIVRKY
jgi:hypothetical protein